MENRKIYENLAVRNGWSLSYIDGRPYFMKDGDYAVPDVDTKEEDKELLAEIICEGSDEMKLLILDCWNNDIIISGPCSGISEFHDKAPHALHFSFAADEDLIMTLMQNVKANLPDLDCYISERKGKTRCDMSYFFGEKELSKEQSNAIFRVIREQLELLLLEKKSIKKH